MYIAVICGGLSAERDVSISSGTGAARALRARGHKVALVDLFLGNPSAVNDPRSVFTSDAGDSVYSVRETEPDLDKIRAQRGGKGLIGPGVADDGDFVFPDVVVQVHECLFAALVARCPVVFYDPFKHQPLHLPLCLIPSLDN